MLFAGFFGNVASHKKQIIKTKKEAITWQHVIVIVAAAVATYYLSEWLGESTDKLSRAGRISPLVRGLVLDAITSSFPEFATVIVGLMYGTFEVGLGTIAGSAIFNIIVIPAVCGIAVGGLRLDRKVILRDGVIYLTIVVAFVLVTAFGVTESPEHSRISALSGWVGIIAYIFYVGMMFLLVGRDNNGENSIKLSKPEWVWHFARVGLTMAEIGVASHFMVGSGLVLARAFGISEVALGVTVLAVATSLPDTFISLKAACRGDTEGAQWPMRSAPTRSTFSSAWECRLYTLAGLPSSGAKVVPSFFHCSLPPFWRCGSCEMASSLAKGHVPSWLPSQSGGER